MRFQKPYGRRLCRALLICIFFLFSIGALVSTYLLATYLPRRDQDSIEITLPSLVGEVLTDSDERLPSDLYEVVYDYRSSKETAPGTVLSQEPRPGSRRRVVPGRAPCTLRLTVSTGAAQYTLPPMIGKSGKEATLQLQAQGLIVQIEQQTRKDLSPGQIVAVEPPEGSVVREGEVVTLTVSRVLTHKTVRVPDVLGSEQALANNALVLRGLKPDEPEYEYSASVPMGCVISQRPLSGTLVPAGSSAHLVISRGGLEEEELILENGE